MKRTFLSATALAVALPLAVMAQDAQQPQSERPDGPPPGPPPGQRPPPPIIMVLDTDKDGILSASEIQNAPISLRKLDKNGDGQLGPGELNPPPPNGERPKALRKPQEGQGSQSSS